MRILVLLLAGAVAAGGAPRGKRAPDSPRALFLKRCSACHDPGRVYHRVASRDEWREIVARMRRMPQSGIRESEAEAILSFLTSLQAKSAPAPNKKVRFGGRKAYGPEWLSILETAVVKKGRVALGGRRYRVAVKDLAASLKRGKNTWLVSLTAAGAPERTALIDTWRVGKVTYELHFVLYEIAGGTVRLGRAIKRTR